MPWYLEVLLRSLLVLIPLHALLLWRVLRAACIGLGLSVRGAFGVGTLLLLWGIAAPLVALWAYQARTSTFDWQLWMERILYGSTATDFLLMYPFWFGLVVSLQITPYLIVFEVLLVMALRSFIDESRDLRRRMGARILFGCACLGVVYISGRVYFDTNHVRKFERELAITGLPAELDGLRIAHISDVQADHYTGPIKLDRYRRAINELEPDLVVFTGDLITRDPDMVAPGARMLGALETRHGVFAVMGDHDVWYARGLVRRELGRAGVVLREDRNVLLRIRGKRVALTMLTAVYRRKPALPRLKRLARATRGSDLRIMIGHQTPDDVAAFAGAAGYDLYFGGHTHGGQILFSFFGFDLSAALKETRFISGLYTAAGMPVHVNNGLGMTLAPIRFQAPASVSLLILRR